MVGRALNIGSHITVVPAEVQRHSCLPIPFSGGYIIRSIRFAVFSGCRHVRVLQSNVGPLSSEDQSFGLSTLFLLLHALD